MTKQAQIIREIEQQIAVGRLKPGQMLPTQKQLMDRYGVAIGTIQQALGQLQTRGVVASRRGRGTMVCEVSNLQNAGLVHPRVEMLQLADSRGRDQLVSDTAAMIQRTLVKHGFEMSMRYELPASMADLKEWAQSLRAVVAIDRLPARVMQVLRQAHRPIIIAGELHEQPCPPGVSQVTVAVENIMQLVMASITSQGHERIALVRGPDTTYTAKLGANFQEQARQLQMADSCQQWIMPLTTDGADIHQRWQRTAPAQRPTAVIIDGGQRACRVIYTLMRQGMRIPEDLSVFAISGQLHHQLSIPTLSRVETTCDRLGTRLAHVLLEVLSQRVVVRETIVPLLVRGDTCIMHTGQEERKSLQSLASIPSPVVSASVAGSGIGQAPFPSQVPLPTDAPVQ